MEKPARKVKAAMVNVVRRGKKRSKVQIERSSFGNRKSFW